MRIARRVAALAAAGLAGLAAAPGGGAGPGVESLIRQAHDRLQSRRAAEAADLFEQALRIEPGNETARFGLAAAWLKAERYAEALPLLTELEARFPENPSIKNNLAWLYVKARDPAVRQPEKGRRYAQEAVLMDPRDYNAWGTLAEAYLAIGRPDRAVRLAAVAFWLCDTARDPAAADFRALHARCRLAAGGGTEAERPAP